MSLELFISYRFLKARKKKGFISLITMLSTAGVAVGVMVLIVVIAVMSGFDSDLKSRLLGVEPHVWLMRHGGALSDYSRVIEQMKHIKGVKTAEPFVYSQVMLRGKKGVTGAAIRGIPIEITERNISCVDNVSIQHKYISHDSGSLETRLPGIFLGKGLAEKIGGDEGDVVYLTSFRKMSSTITHLPEMRPFKVTGIYETGLHEYDSSMAYLHIKNAQDILKMGDAASGIEVWVDDIYKADEIADRLGDILGYPYWARSWVYMNKNLFSMLKLQKTVMFIILILIILVAAFNVASALIMMVMGKTKDIAILKTMGVTNKSIRKIFVFKGTIIGAIGTATGLFGGFSLCTLLKHYQFIELPADVYLFATTLPVKVEALDVLMITVASMLICFIATLYPAYYASRLDPVKGIRVG